MVLGTTEVGFGVGFTGFGVCFAGFGVCAVDFGVCPSVGFVICVPFGFTSCPTAGFCVCPPAGFGVCPTGLPLSGGLDFTFPYVKQINYYFNYFYHICFIYMIGTYTYYCNYYSDYGILVKTLNYLKMTRNESNGLYKTIMLV